MAKSDSYNTIQHLEEEIKKLKKKNKIYENILANTPVAVSVYDENGLLSYINDKQKEVLGFEEGENPVGKFNVLTDEFTLSNGYAKVYERVYRGIPHEHIYEYDFGLSSNKWKMRKDIRIFKEKILPFTDEDKTLDYVVSYREDVTEIHKATEALKESEKRFKDISFAMADWIWEIDTQGRYTWSSENVKDILGYSSEEVTGKTFFDFMPDDEAHKIKALFIDTVKKQKSILDLENWSIDKNGDYKCLVINGIPFFDENHHLIGYRGTNKDITIRKNAESKIRESEARLKEAQSLAKLGNWELDLIRNELYWSDEIFRIFNIDQSKFGATYEAFVECIHPEDREMVDQAYKAHINDKEPYNIEHRLLLKDGTVKYVQERCTSKFDSHGNPLVSTGTVQDITTQKETEHKIAIQKERLLLATHAARLGVCDLNLISRELSCNTETYAILDINESTENNAPLDKVLQKIHHEDISVVKQAIQGKLHKEEEFDIEFRIFITNKIIRYINLIAKIFQDSDGKPIRMIGILKDITHTKENELVAKKINEKLEYKVKERTAELERTKNELFKSLDQERKANELKSRFVSTASHQFRTPLTVIHSSAEIMGLLSEQLEEELKYKFLRSLKRINQESKRMKSLMDDVLQIEKINSGVVSINKEVIDIKEVIDDIVTSMNGTKKYSSTIVLNYHYPAKSLQTDKTLFSHVIINILENAQKYSLEKTDVYFSVYFKEDYLELIIKDTGIGMTPDDLSLLFQPFYRGSNSQGIHGTGLGMSIVKEYIDLTGGNIDVISKLNEGTTIKLLFSYQ